MAKSKSVVQMRVDDDLLAEIDAAASKLHQTRTTWLLGAAIARLDGATPAERTPPPRAKGADVKPQDCHHPVARRLGTVCMDCGKDLKR